MTCQAVSDNAQVAKVYISIFSDSEGKEMAMQQLAKLQPCAPDSSPPVCEMCWQKQRLLGVYRAGCDGCQGKFLEHR